jgi:hypothetical protein
MQRLQERRDPSNRSDGDHEIVGSCNMIARQTEHAHDPPNFFSEDL